MIKVYYPKERIDVGIGQTKVLAVRTEKADYRAPFKTFVLHPNSARVEVDVLSANSVRITNNSNNVVMLQAETAFYGTEYKTAVITAEIQPLVYNLPITARQERALIRTGSTLEDLNVMSVEELEAIKGISKAIAKRIYNVLHPAG